MATSIVPVFSSIIPRDVFLAGRLDDDQQIDLQQYFLDVRKRQAEGERFPFDLDELVPSVYTQKVNAIKTLTSKFAQDIDYSTVYPEVKCTAFGTGAQPIKYMLSSAAFEFMVAKKNRAIFEVYRRVFHAAVDTAEKAKMKSLKFLAGEWEAAKKLAASVGLEGNMIVFSANRAMLHYHDVNIMEMMGQPCLPSEETAPLMNASTLGIRICPALSANSVNKKLETLGYQTHYRDADGHIRWSPTEKGFPHGRWEDVPKQNNPMGSTVQQWKWRASILDVLV